MADSYRSPGKEETDQKRKLEPEPRFEVISSGKRNVAGTTIHIIESPKGGESNARKTYTPEERIASFQTALDVLLDKLHHQERKIEEKVMSNVEQTILPVLEKVKRSGLNANQKMLVDIIEENLRDLTSSFSGKLSSKMFGCTAIEIQVANMVKLGYTSKEIADKMNLSPKTISAHRDSIRKKLGIQNKKINLRTFLMNRF